MVQLFSRLTVLLLLLTFSSAPQEIPLEAFPVPMRYPIAEAVLYRLFLEQAAVFEQQARTRESRGQDGEAFRHHLQHQFGLTQEELSGVAPAALRFYDQLNQLRSQQQAIARRFRAQAFSNQRSIALSLLPALPPELSTMDQQIATLSRNARDQIQAMLTPSHFVQLNFKLHQRDSFYKSFLKVRPGSPGRKAVPGVYGYASLDVDPATKQVTAYATTEMDGVLLPYYEPELHSIVNDQNRGHDFASFCRKSDSHTIVCQFAADPSAYAYIIDTEHSVRLLVQNQANRQWVDAVAYEYVANLDIAQSFEIQFTGQGPPAFLSDPVVSLGHTFIWNDW